jgi:signal transduction histidine kinase
MFERRSLKWPITLGVTMIVLLVLLLVGWILLTLFGLGSAQNWGFYLTLLAVGTTSLVAVLVGVVMYLSLSVKAINLNRRQSNFMDSVTHELKSPIASLKLCLQTLNRHSVRPEEQASFFRFMLEDVERLDHLINHLLDAARLDRKPMQAEVEEIELAEVLQQCTEEIRLRYRAPEEAVTIHTEPSIVLARRVDIDMIFRNVIDNAFKYSNESPQIEVVSQVKDDYVITEIKDNGHGIPHRWRRKIFARFVRLGMELEREKPGTGLGLYIVDTLVRRLRGKVRVTDRSSGTGTTFEISLPGRRASSNVESAERAKEEADSPVTSASFVSE